MPADKPMTWAVTAYSACTLLATNWRWVVNAPLGLLYLPSPANELGGHDLAVADIAAMPA
jgi:hypothetical protein